MDKLNAFYRLVYDPNENPSITRMKNGRYISCYSDGNDDVYIGTCTRTSPMREFIQVTRQADGSVAFPTEERFAGYLESWSEYIDELISKLPDKKRQAVMNAITVS